jgi:MYXO-CTERM domain-containing protein
MKTALTVAAVLTALALCADAHATPDFPGAVEMALMLPAGTIASKVDPPDGCHLCHVNGSQGGDPLTAFGTLMKANGAVAFQAGATAATALSAIQSMDPQTIADLKMGVDPNSDMSVTSTDPVPEYGCASRVAARGHAGWPAAALVMAAMAGVRRRRRSSSRVPYGPVSIV